jgi:hypothetical protein
MNQPNGDPGREPAARHSTARERELELELARVSAELESMQGGDLMQTTSRFLEMAANTVDLAMADARREADELAAEISADAERRRDDAVRIASEAETTAARLQAEATDSEATAAAARAAAQQVTLGAKRDLETARAEAEEIIDEACTEAEKLESAAATAAAEIIEQARAQAREELEVLTNARAELERERASMREYNGRLGTRVQDLADSMVAFMTMESPLTGISLGAYAPGELDAAGAPPAPASSASTDAEVTPAEPVESEPLGFDLVASAHPPAVADHEAMPVGDPEESVASEELPPEEVVPEQPMPEQVMPEAVAPAPTPSETVPADPFARFGEASEPTVPLDDEPTFAEAGAEPLGVDLPAFGSASTDPVSTPDFDTAEFRVETTASSELFGSATPDEVEPSADEVEPSADEVEPSPLSDLFRNHGARLIEQTPPEELTDVLGETDSAADERFQDFIDGDDGDDPSRDWLLRPETS